MLGAPAWTHWPAAAPRAGRRAARYRRAPCSTQTHPTHPSGPLPAPVQVNYWLGGLMEVKSNDLYRMKGVLAIKDFPARFVFQG